MVAEHYLEWLEREEEVIGIAGMMGMPTDIEEAQEFLRTQLGLIGTEGQAHALLETVATKYEGLPEIGVSFSRVEQVWGKQSIYRDIETGRFVSKTFVQQALERLEL